MYIQRQPSSSLSLVTRPSCVESAISNKCVGASCSYSLMSLSHYALLTRDKHVHMLKNAINTLMDFVEVIMRECFSM